MEVIFLLVLAELLRLGVCCVALLYVGELIRQGKTCLIQ